MAAIVCLAVSVSTVFALQQTPAISRVRDAEAVLDAIVAGDFAAVVAKFDATMKAALTEQTLRSGWTSLGNQLGKIVKRAPPREVPEGKYLAVVILCDFERGQLQFTVVFDVAGAIAGLSLRPPVAPYAPPPYADPASYAERQVTVGSDEWALPGTLTLPNGAGPFPAVVLVHGSGPNDRDETLGPNKPFKDIALGLASQGVAVLRYDKRTLVHAKKLAAVKPFTVKEETIDDAVAAAALLRNEASIDKARIFALGHSLGGMVAPRIAAADPKLAGIIIMAGAVRELPTAILEQYQYLFGADGTVTAEEQQRIDDAKKLIADVAALTATDANSDRMLGNVPASYWFDLRGFDPPATAAKLPQRILVLQGERDYQVIVAEFEKWKAALASRPDAEFHLYPALNHLFQPGTGKSLPAEYNVPGHVPVEVIRDIAAWIKR